MNLIDFFTKVKANDMKITYNGKPCKLIAYVPEIDRRPAFFTVEYFNTFTEEYDETSISFDDFDKIRIEAESEQNEAWRRGNT